MTIRAQTITDQKNVDSNYSRNVIFLLHPGDRVRLQVLVDSQHLHDINAKGCFA